MNLKRLFLALPFWWLMCVTQVVTASDYLLFIDCSGSMQGAKAAAAKAGAQLFVAMLDDDATLQVVAFNTHSTTSPRFQLKDEQRRDEAINWIGRLTIGGGTNYLSALQAITPADGTTAVFLSDGDHDGSAETVIQDLRQRYLGKTRFHCVSVDCPGKSSAEQLLTRMAVLTGGSYSRVEKSEELVSTFAAIAVRVGKYYRHTPSAEEVRLSVVAPGTLFGVGYDGIPELKSSTPSNFTRHRADLPGEKVNLARYRLTEPQDVVLRLTGKETPNARLGDIHLVGGGLPAARWQLDTNSAGNVPTNGPLQVTVEFLDGAGSPLNLRIHNQLGAEVELRTPDGKVLDKAQATQSADEHQLRATLKVPMREGALSVHGQATVKTSNGTVFRSEAEQSVMAAKPAKLVAKPQRLEQTTKVGGFSAMLTVSVEGSPQSVPGITAEILDGPKGLRLVETSSKDGQLTLHFEASAVGTHRGTLSIRANSERLVEPLSIPFRFVVEPNSKGLNLDKLKEITFGKVAANAGDVSTSVELLSLDDKPLEYTVTIDHLSGSTGTIDVLSDPHIVTPTRTAPAVLKLTANVVNATAGIYRGQVFIRDKASDLGREWTLNLTLEVTEPLSASPIDVGSLAVGQSVTRVLRLANRSPHTIKDISLIPPKEWSASKEMTDDIEATFVENKLELPGKAERDFKLRVVVSPLIKVRGPVTGSLMVRRGDVDAVSVPIRLTVVEEIDGPSMLSVSPMKLTLSASSGDVAEFSLKCRLSADAEADDTLTVQFENVTGPDGRPCELSSDFEWKESAKLARSASVPGRGFVIAPKRIGRYTAEVRVSSQFAGSVVVPLSLTVR